MRENFIISADKNNGYPSFSDSIDLDDTDFYKNKNQSIADGISYPKYLGKNIESEKFRIFSNNMFLLISDVNNGYPVLACWHRLKQSVFSDIYSRNRPAKIIYYNGIPIKAVYFRNKAVYRFGFSE
mgnify:FL=1